MPDNHALLGPSGAARWLACPPSARLEEHEPETYSLAAEKGQLAHELAEQKLLQWIDPNAIKPRTFRDRVRRIKQKIGQEGDLLWEDKMDANTDIYLDTIKEIANELLEPPFVAAEKQVDLSAYIPESFGTADCIVLGSGVIHVIDYKNGIGVQVDARDNPQMKLYALGALLKYKDFFPIETVRMTIVQPNISQTPDTFEMTAADLLTWAEEIKPRAAQAFKGEGLFLAGDHCRFCKVATTCRARRDYILSAEGFAPALPPTISLEEAAEALRRAEGLAGYITKLKDHLLAQALAGEEVPGWKAVEGRSVRRFTDLEAAFKKAEEAGVALELLYERKPITLAALEKVMTKPVFTKEMAEFVDKPPGAPTLVPSTDKRQPITKDTAADDFADATKE